MSNEKQQLINAIETLPDNLASQHIIILNI